MDDFLTDLANAGASAHTRHAYRGDLIAFAAHHGEDIGELTAAPIRAYLAELADLLPASRKRNRAVIASFAKWAIRHDLLTANPMGPHRHGQGAQEPAPPGRGRRRGQGAGGDLLAAAA
ncbi:MULTISPECIES: site-specific integrase [unclassified Nonomuraea]|uniref:site-specific integrase n=1 Tax=unclassified Nonomuraea TaxID=2593643 RepID=UPI0033C47110